MYSDRFYAFEGLNGAGKSTVLTALREANTRSDLKFIKDPPDRDALTKYINMKRKAGTDERFLAMLYAASSYQLHSRYRYDLASPFCKVVGDRSPISTFAYYMHLGIDWLFHIHTGCVFPAHVLCFVANEADIRFRLGQRELSKEDVDREIAENEGLLRRYDVLRPHFSGTTFYSVETSGRSPAETIEQVRQILGV